MDAKDLVRTTCPRDCYDACGIVVVRRDGKIAKVLGDPEHKIARGALCGKCAIAYNGVWRDPASRLATPLRRIGRKGEGSFAPIGWGGALALIAERLHSIRDEGAAQTIYHTHYTGTVGLLAGWFPLRFFNRIGATEIDPDTVCNKAGHATLEAIFGTSLEGFDPRTVAEARTVLVWGANPSTSAPHQDKRWLRQARESGATIIVVDPIAHATARAADIHLQVAPGTDAALAFALLNAIEANGLFDEAFVAAHVAVTDEFRAEIRRMTPDRAAAICKVPAESIRQAALHYGLGPSLLWLGQGVQRQPSGGNIFRALAALVAMTGNVGKPGRGFLYMNGPGIRGIDMDMLTAPGLAQTKVPATSHMDLSAALGDPARVRAFFNWNNNPAASSPRQGALRDALQREDLFHVAIDLFHTDTTAYADLVLPAASFLEFDDLVLPYFDLTLSAQVKAAEPPGEALPNQEIFRRLAAAMGFDDPELFETDEALIARLLAATGFTDSFDDLAKLGTVDLFPEPRVQFAGLSFATPSGRIEIASERLAALGLPLNPVPHADAAPADGALRILSPASLWLMNSSYGNDATIAGKLGLPVALLHPQDAARRGLADGDEVRLQNAHGTLPVAIRLSAETQPGVAVVHKGRWPSQSGGANVNVLVSDRKSDIAESTTVHGTEAYILPVEAAARAASAPAGE